MHIICVVQHYIEVGLRLAVILKLAAPALKCKMCVCIVLLHNLHNTETVSAQPTHALYLLHFWGK